MGDMMVWGLMVLYIGVWDIWFDTAKNFSEFLEKVLNTP
jgi:hypothetical protein